MYSCAYCGNLYSRKDSAKRHENTHIEIFHCPCCDLTFTYKTNLMRHIKHRHREYTLR